MVYHSLAHRLYEFRSTGKYCDVDVRVQDTIFHCHRLVLASISEYFDTVFIGNNGNETTSKDVILNIIEPLTFKTILEYAYHGGLPAIDSSNVDIFLKAGIFLQISDIVSSCEEFIYDNISCLPRGQLFKLLGLTYTLNLSSKDHLSQYISQNLMDLVRLSAFLEVPYETLKIVMKKYRSSVSYIRENSLLDGLIQWIFHSYRDRRKYFEELEKMIDFEKISTKYVEHLSKTFEADDKLEASDKTSLRIKIKNFVLNSRFAQDHRLLTIYEDSQNSGDPTIHIFMISVDETESRYKFYSLDEKRLEPEWICSRRFWKKHDEWETFIVEFTPFNDRIYCFTKVRSEYSFEGTPSFCAYSSLDFSSESPQVLSSFPLARQTILSDSLTALTGFGNDSIYLYSSNIYHFSHLQNATRNFNEEEYNRNFYVYSLTQDEWLPVNPMKRAVKKASLIADDELVYLIGGEDKSYYGGNENIAGYAQAYDPRLQSWLKLPRTNFSHRQSLGCNLNGKIYVWNGEHIEVYDPQASSWQATRCNFVRKGDVGRKLLLPFKNQLYLFDLYYSQFCTYDPVSQQWSSLTPLETLLSVDKNRYFSSTLIRKIFVF